MLKNFLEEVSFCGEIYEKILLLCLFITKGNVKFEANL